MTIDLRVRAAASYRPTLFDPYIYVDANVSVRCLRENENTEYTHNWILETECMSFGFVSEKIAGWEGLA